MLKITLNSFLTFSISKILSFFVFLTRTDIMKKLLFTLLSLTFIVTSAQAQLDLDNLTKSKTARQMLDEFSKLDFDVWITQSLKGKIKSYKTTQFEVEKTWTETPYPTDDIKPTFTEKNQGTLLLLFDEQSRIQKNSVNEESIGMEYAIEYKYRGTSNLREQIIISEKIEERDTKASVDFIYNSNNQLESANIREENGQPFSASFLYKYSPDGKLSEFWVKYDGDDLPKKNKVFEYENDKLVRILAADKYDGENGKESLAIENELSYDNKGRLISIKREFNELQIAFDNAGNIKQEIEFEYMGDTSKIITYQYNNLNEEIARTETQYNYATRATDVIEESDVIGKYDGPETEYKQYLYSKKITEYKNGIIVSVTKYEWDDDKNMMQLVSKETAENEFDKQGNLIKQIMRNSDGEITEKIICEIVYY